MLHEKNWRENLRVLEFHHPQNVPWILAATPRSQNTTIHSVPSWIPFFVFRFLLAWVSSGRPDLSSTEVDTCTGEMSLSIRSSRSRVWISLTVGEEDEDEEDDKEWLSCFKGVMDVEGWELEEELVDKPGTTIGTKFSVLHCFRIPFLMRCGFWPLIYSWEYPFSSQSFPSVKTAGVSSKTFIVKNISNSLTYTVASSCVCTSPLAVMTVVGLLDVVKLSNSASFKSFLLIICIDTPQSTTNSFLKFKGWWRRQAPIFWRWEECCVIFLLQFEDIFSQLPRCFTGTSFLPFRLLLRPILKFWSVGVALMRFTWANHSERRILVLNVSMTYHSFRESNTSDWFLHLWAHP